MTFRIPALSATVEWCLLITYRLDPAVARTLLPRTLLPSALRPQLVDVAATGIFASDQLPTLAPTSKFFQAGSIDWSPTRNGLGLQGLQLTIDRTLAPRSQRGQIETDS